MRFDLGERRGSVKGLATFPPSMTELPNKLG